jgi:TolA-binding protein
MATMSDKNTDSGLEFLESPEGLAGELGKVEKVITGNQNIIYIVVGGVVALIAAFFGYRYYVSSQDEAAQSALSTAVFAFESDSLNKALKGVGGNPGLLSVADEYGATPSGNLAHFYAGAALLKQGKYDEAIEHLKSFSSSDLLVQARAYALLGDAYSDKGTFDEAVGYYKKAAEYKPNAFFTPGYLVKLAIAQEKAKQTKEAVETYTSLIEKYPQAPEVINAKKYKGLLESQLGE